MRMLLGFLLAVWAASDFVPAEAASASRRASRAWEASLVMLEVSRQQYDYAQPWARRPVTVLKAGVVVRPREILTTAADLPDHTVVRAQKGGRGEWYPAQVTWVDYPANLALVTVDDSAFWKGLRAVRLAGGRSTDRELRVVRWRGGNLENRQAEFSRFAVNNPNAGEAAHAVLEINSEIDGTGWGEVVARGQEVAGLIYAQTGNLCQVLPAPFIQAILEAHRQGAYPGLGYFDFTWQPTENPETLRYLRWATRGRGVVVIQVPQRSSPASVLKPRDLLLQVGGHDIDNQGDYNDPVYGHLMLEALSTRGRWAGDRIRLKIWRDGQSLDVDYVLPKIEDSARLVPEAPYDRPPEYLISGGLVFQPLTRNLLRSWGQDWERSAPFRLAYCRNEEATPERPAVVVLTGVLPDQANMGYQEIRNLVVEKANGQPVSNLRELAKALERPPDGFHVLDFMAGETLQRLVLDASQTAESTRRILQRYGIAEDRFLHATQR